MGRECDGSQSDLDRRTACANRPAAGGTSALESIGGVECITHPPNAAQKALAKPQTPGIAGDRLILGCLLNMHPPIQRIDDKWVV